MIGRFRSRFRCRKALERSNRTFCGPFFLTFGFWSLFTWGGPSVALATGFYGPVQYLDNGGRNVDLSPEFYWELEVKRLSGRFHPPEKLRLAKIEESNEDPVAQNPKLIATAEAEAKDFDLALQEGRIKPPDPEKARQDHQAIRTLVSKTNDKTANPFPEEYDSEFADYDRGAFAYRRGKEHWAEAAKIWLQLLQRPEAERHYRTVWALFMLGKIALKNGDPEAVTWFRETREAAKSGFADSLGMAADSYGWEGRSEWKQNHPEKAAALFLTQLALGDTSAIVSLKALIPDRSPVEGMLNYGMEADDLNKLSIEQKSDVNRKTQTALQSAARDPLLRSLVTAHILATESTAQNPTGTTSVPQTGPETRCGRWLQAINEAKLIEVNDAEYLGWVAYNNGSYSEAERWLQLAKNESPATNWLRAKLQRRKGEMNEAAKSMEKAWESIHDLARYTGWSGTTEDRYLTGHDDIWSFDGSASGDLGGLRLERDDFVQALETFWRGGLWDDAAYVAERVLSTAELQEFVDQQPDAAGSVDFSAPSTGLGNLRYLLGRRLVREDQYQDAARYLKPPYDKILAKYVQALTNGANQSLPKEGRARAWFTAAWLARYDGMELMGTEAAPDGFNSGGAFPNVDLAKQRTSGFWTLSTYVDGKEEHTKLPLVIKPSKQEVKRLGQFRTMPDVRFHYRIIAAALAMRAAALLPDHTAELADVINTAGRWVADRDDRDANRYYKQLTLRCANTPIGRSAIVRKWFVDDPGPWSTEEAANRTAMRQALGIHDE
jgi:tetratricopeptide (TPR) repeat protein